MIKGKAHIEFGKGDVLVSLISVTNEDKPQNWLIFRNAKNSHSIGDVPKGEWEPIKSLDEVLVSMHFDNLESLDCVINALLTCRQIFPDWEILRKEITNEM